MAESIPSRRTTILIVFATVFFDFSGYALIVPVMPYFKEELHGTDAELGLVFTVYAVTQLISSLYMGWGSDIWGRRLFVMLSLIGSFVGAICQGLSRSMLQLTIFRGLTGLFAGSGVVAQAVIADVTPIDERPRYLARLEAAVALSYVTGPALGGLLSLVFIRLPFFVAGGVAGFALILAYFLFRETRPEIVKLNQLKKKKRKLSGKEREDTVAEIKVIQRALRTSQSQNRPRFNKLIIMCFASDFFNRWAVMAFDSIYGVFLMKKFGTVQWQFALINTLQGFWCLFQQGFLYSVIIYKWNCPIPATAGVGGVVVSVAYLIMAFGSPAIVSIIGSFVMWMGFSLASTASASILSSVTHKDQQGYVLAWNNVIGQFSLIISPLVLSRLIDVRLELPYVVSVIPGLVLVCLMFSILSMPNGKTLGRVGVSPGKKEIPTEQHNSDATEKEEMAEEGMKEMV